MGMRTTTSQSLELMTLTTPVASSVMFTTPAVIMPPKQCHGKASPVDSFTAEDPEIRRAAVWNGWSEEETLMQPARYLRNRALQEWNLLSQEHHNTFEGAVNPGNQTLAALDFHHAVQKDSEAVADYIRRLSK